MRHITRFWYYAAIIASVGRGTTVGRR